MQTNDGFLLLFIDPKIYTVTDPVFIISPDKTAHYFLLLSSVTLLVLITSWFYISKSCLLWCPYHVYWQYWFNTQGSLDTLYRIYFNNIRNKIYLSYLFCTVQSRSVPVWREVSAKKCVFSLCVLSWEEIQSTVKIWVENFRVKFGNIHLCSVSRNAGVAQGSTVILPFVQILCFSVFLKLLLLFSWLLSVIVHTFYVLCVIINYL